MGLHHKIQIQTLIHLMFPFALNETSGLACCIIESKPQHVDLDTGPASTPLESGILLIQGFVSRLLVICATKYLPIFYFYFFVSYFRLQKHIWEKAEGDKQILEYLFQNQQTSVEDDR